MHTTLIPSVKGNIDKVTKTSATSSKVVGWIFGPDLKNPSLRLNCNDIITNIKCTERKDVTEFYTNKPSAMCGWEININTEETTKLEIKLANKWECAFLFESSKPQFALSTKVPSFLVVDNFYENPDAVRQFALQCDFKEHKSQHKGARTDATYRFHGLKERFEYLLGTKIKNWDFYCTNGTFQYCIGGDQIVYHHDEQQYAGVLYLTPDAPVQGGTCFYRSKHTKKNKVTADEHKVVFNKGFLDPTEFERMDTLANVYNRLVLFDAKLIHAGNDYFGTTKENGRLFQLFFFDLE